MRLMTLTAQRTTSPVTWHPQSGEKGEVTGAEATLFTTEWGRSVSFETVDLGPGHVYTLWWIVVNEPAACEAHPEPCIGKDVFADGNPAKAQVSYVVGNVTDDDGETTFSAHVAPGPISAVLQQ